MSVAPKFAADGWFPFCVAELTSAQIEGYTGKITSASPTETGVVKLTGLSLQQVWTIFWMTESWTSTMTLGLGPSTSVDIPMAATGGGIPSSRVCYQGERDLYAANFSGFPSSPSDGDLFNQVSVGITTRNYLENPDAPPSHLVWGPIVKNTDDGTYTLLLDIEINVIHWKWEAGSVTWNVVQSAFFMSDYDAAAPYTVVDHTFFGKTVTLAGELFGATTTFTDPIETYYT
ncbi:MAG TPA: hypothetical protein VL357_02990 [Rariglobus sp.]|jgi:hypothetical protein|nr:hypothetical protein [Rariglobus sp.]